MHRSPIVIGGTCLGVGLAVALAAPRPVAACGGCFSPPDTVTRVDAHRMAIALSPTRTILWDQIRYSGSPEDFVWVLPVPTEAATIDVADDLFFSELEAQTAVQVFPPPLPQGPTCPPPPPGVGLGAQDAAAASPDAGVDVYREEVVGPYQTVVIGSEDANALVNWLNDHDYVVPEATIPVVQGYADRGDRFIVLRLAPDQGVEAMQPIRVEYPGYMGTFPLEMVTVGAYGKLALTLWVIAEQRYETKNYPTIEIDPDAVIWDFLTFQSNYRELFRGNIDASGGRGWIAQFAQPLSSLWLSSDEVEAAYDIIPYPFLTRLETDLLVDHLTADLELGPAAGGALSNVIQAQRGLNAPPPPPCPDWDGNGIPDDQDALFSGGCSTAGGSGAALGLLAFVGLAIRRRRRRA